MRQDEALERARRARLESINAARRVTGRPPAWDPRPEGPRELDLVTVTLALMIVAWMGVAALVAAKGCEAPPPPPPSLVELPDLDELEARLVAGAEAVRRWEELARRHREAAAVVCEDLAWHAEGSRDARTWLARGGD